MTERLLNLLDAVTDHRADYFGECDRCHLERRLFIDHTEPGEFAYCADCVGRMIRRHNEQKKRGAA
jgi:hypothetical protein